MEKLSSVIGVRKSAGFTLIEVLIVVVIVGILAAIAYPSYVNHVTRTYRDAAKACLAEHAQYMERYYTSNLTYDIPEDDLPVLGCTTEGNFNTRYTISFDDLARGTYTAVATPIGAQLANDTACGTLKLNQKGEKKPSSGTCW